MIFRKFDFFKRKLKNSGESCHDYFKKGTSNLKLADRNYHQTSSKYVTI
jgi:hypothetical protein